MGNKKLTTIVLLLSLFWITIFPFKGFATSWVYLFVVWDGYIYVISDEYVTNIDKEIGEVRKYSDMESYGGNFSNVYPKGTKYYSILDINTEVAIAVEDKLGYKKAIRDGAYTYRENPIQNNGFQFVYLGLGSVAILVLGLIIYSSKRENLQQ